MTEQPQEAKAWRKSINKVHLTMDGMGEGVFCPIEELQTAYLRGIKDGRLEMAEEIKKVLTTCFPQCCESRECHTPDFQQAIEKELARLKNEEK